MDCDISELIPVRSNSIDLEIKSLFDCAMGSFKSTIALLVIQTTDWFFDSELISDFFDQV